MSGPFAQINPLGGSPFSGQGISAFPATSQSQSYGQPFGVNPLQHVVQSLQVVPYQLHHLLQLAQIQQQQVQYLLQLIPQQLQLLQQQLQGQTGFQSFTPYQGFGAGFQQSSIGVTQPFSAQPGQVM